MSVNNVDWQIVAYNETHHSNPLFRGFKGCIMCEMTRLLTCLKIGTPKTLTRCIACGLQRGDPPGRLPAKTIQASPSQENLEKKIVWRRSTQTGSLLIGDFL